VVSAIVGACAGGFASFKVQRKSQLRTDRAHLYMAHLLPFHAEAERLSDDVRSSSQPVANDSARNACRALFREAVVTSDRDTTAVEDFAQQLEAMRTKHDAFVKAHARLSGEESEEPMRQAAAEQHDLWTRLLDDIWTYRRLLEAELTGRGRGKPLFRGNPPDWVIHG